MQDWQIDKTVDVKPGSIQILTPGGYRNVIRAFRTHAMPVWELHTSSLVLRGAGMHRVVRSDGAVVWLKDLYVGDFIKTETGLQAVTEITDHGEDQEWEPLYDFEIESEDHLYFTGGILSHNSTTLAARQKIYADIVPGYRSLYIAPHQDHVKTYADRLREMERAFRFPTNHPNYRQNLTYKEFPNKSNIKLIRVLSNANSARGNTADELLFDEYQHFDDSLMPEVEQVQKASKMPCTVYAGTSLTVDTALESKWLMSSGGTWWMKHGCGQWINCGDQNSVLPCIRPDGFTCPKCSRIMDVTQGSFVHADRSLLKCGWIGLHVPQVIIPDFVKDIEKWNEIFTSFQRNGLSKFLQEILGIPTEEGAREITLDNLKTMCCLPESSAYLQKRASKGYYKWVVSGCDWGGSDYLPAFQQKISTTVHAILGITQDGNFDIIHLKRYSGMGYKEIANQIIEDHVRCGGGPIATDFGVGALYNHLLRESPKILAERHLVFNYVGPTALMISQPATGGMFNQYSLNRTEAITAVYEAIKRVRLENRPNPLGVMEAVRIPNPRIRCYDFKQSGEYLIDFLNLVRAPTESALGTNAFKYRRHGSKPDDTLHAVNFAYQLGRILLGEPLLEDLGLRERLDQLMRTKSTPALSGQLPTRLRPYAG